MWALKLWQNIQQAAANHHVQRLKNRIISGSSGTSISFHTFLFLFSDFTFSYKKTIDDPIVTSVIIGTIKW